jgi:hypothetical protein
MESAEGQAASAGVAYWFAAGELCEIASAVGLTITIVFLPSHRVAGVVLVALFLGLAIALGCRGGVLQSRSKAASHTEGPRRLGDPRTTGVAGEHQGGSSADEGGEGPDESGGPLPAALGRA